MNGCSNCRWCKCYPGDYWTPDDFECTGDLMQIDGDLDLEYSEEELDNIITRVWENGEEWAWGEKPICPCWEEFIYDPYEDEMPDSVWEAKLDARKEIEKEEG